jgi:hypothetical protein
VWIVLGRIVHGRCPLRVLTGGTELALEEQHVCERVVRVQPVGGIFGGLAAGQELLADLAGPAEIGPDQVKGEQPHQDRQEAPGVAQLLAELTRARIGRLHVQGGVPASRHQ